MKYKLIYSDVKSKWFFIWHDGDFVGMMVVGKYHNRFCSGISSKNTRHDKELDCMYDI